MKFFYNGGHFKIAKSKWDVYFPLHILLISNYFFSPYKSKAYLGCYADELDNRQLRGINSTSKDICLSSAYSSWFTSVYFSENNTMTIDLCNRICSICQFQYMGVDFGYHLLNIIISLNDRNQFYYFLFFHLVKKNLDLIARVITS